MTLALEVSDQRFEDIKSKVQADREFVDTRLSRIDDSAVI
jgi:hypothetical protein